MYITLLCVGKIKEKYWQAAIDEYAKRLAKYHQFKIVTVADEKDPAQESDKAICALKDKEAERLAKHIKDDDFVITLEIGGKELDTLALADTFRRWETNGLGERILRRSDFALSFSKLTFPHQLMRVIFCEQLYRCARVNAGQKYHK